MIDEKETMRRDGYLSLYKAWRKAVFECDNYTCQLCGVRGGKLQAHHIHPVRDNKNLLLLFNVNNGITLCKTCHCQIFGCEEEFELMFDAIVSGYPSK